MDPVGTVVNTLSGLKLALDFYKIACELQDVPETARVFVGILEQVNRDITYARDFYKEIQSHRRDSRIQFQWIVDVITTNNDEIASFGNYVSQLDLSKSLDIPTRVKFILREDKCLKDKETRLRFAHSRLLAAISTMHLLAFQLGSSSKSSLFSLATKSPAPQQYHQGTEDISVIDEQEAEHIVITTVE
ncbi:hypothetical protein F5Y13DRAFT_75960 [Hypoxylon sp. FL1857]|nr:hypothetical protein F5Y13DRAFT_75960 [Hypoxylon sp. FL1857]